MKSKSRTFYRYILSYALVLFLPIAVLFTLFSSFLFDRYNQEIADSNARLLAQMQENLDTQLEQLVNISFMIQNNAVVNLRTNEGDVVAARKAVDTLNVLHSVSSLPDFLITYRSGTDYCFTTSSRIRPEKLFADQLAYAHHTLEDFYAKAANADYLIYNATIDEPIYTLDQLIAKSDVLADVKAVKEGNVWCTGKYMYQATDIIGDLILDIHRVLADDTGSMAFLYKLQ